MSFPMLALDKNLIRHSLPRLRNPPPSRLKSPTAGNQGAHALDAIVIIRNTMMRSRAGGVSLLRGRAPQTDLLSQLVVEPDKEAGEGFGFCFSVVP
jgi:hypothetical protein